MDTSDPTQLKRSWLKKMAGLGIVAMLQDALAAPPTGNGGCACGRVDVHSHFLPPFYRDALTAAGMVKVDGGVPVPPWSAEAHLAMMAQHRIAHAILSVSSPSLNFIDGLPARALARRINEYAAELRQAHPQKFGFFATVPLSDVPGAVAEARYALDVLKADGVCLETNSKGLYLGDARFAPLFDELQARGAVLYLHPTSPPCLAQVGMGFPGPLLEFPVDTARTVVNMLFSGTLRQRPDIKVILSHAGGALPGLLSRIAMVANFPIIEPRPAGGAAEVMEQVRRLYFDLALSATPLTFQSLLHITSVSHILFGTDFPFAPPPAIAGNTAGFDQVLAGLSDEQRRMVSYGNAAQLFPRLQQFLFNETS